LFLYNQKTCFAANQLSSKNTKNKPAHQGPKNNQPAQNPKTPTKQHPHLTKKPTKIAKIKNPKRGKDKNINNLVITSNYK
jgi:hypothetical protein